LIVIKHYKMMTPM